MSEIQFQKKTLRKQFNTIRDNSSLELRSEYSRLIIKKLTSQNFYLQTQKCMTYLSFRSEVETHQLAKKIIQQKETVYIPKILPQNQLEAIPIQDFKKDLELNQHKILEPISTLIPNNKNDLDLIIIPGVAFSLNGQRLGYGAGYYDRFLKDINPATIKCGLAFEIQIAEKIPHEDFDIPLDYIITEKRIIDCKRNQ